MTLNNQAHIAEKPHNQPFQKTDFEGAEQAKVLLIEDDRTERRMVRNALNGHCELIEAESAGHGISLYSHHKPDLVFIDIGLPDDSGHGLLQRVLAMNPDAYIVMFSGHSDNNNVFESAHKGAKGFVSKPFDTARMMFFIKQCTSTK